MKKRAIITLATGSQYYQRMALALMISAYKFGGDRYNYVIFSDQDSFPYFIMPEWIKIVKLSDRYYQNVGGNSVRHDSFRIRSMIFTDPSVLDYDVLFLDADCYVFKDSLEEIFQMIEKESMVIYGSFLKEGEIWGKINFPEVARQAGYNLKNMWLNGGFIGRASDKWGLSFVDKYDKFMNSYPFKPYIQSKMWQLSDEPYLAAAYQLTYLEKYNKLPERLSSPSSEVFITTYDADLETKKGDSPILHSRYVQGSFQSSIIHFLGGIDNFFYRSLINRTVSFNTIGTVLRPYFLSQYCRRKARYFMKKLTTTGITEEKDLQ